MKNRTETIKKWASAFASVGVDASGAHLPRNPTSRSVLLVALIALSGCSNESGGGGSAIGGARTSSSSMGGSSIGGNLGAGGVPSAGGTASGGGTTRGSGSTGVGGSVPILARSVAVGYEHACVVLRTGTVQCWGLNTYGQLGNGTTTMSLTPVTVSGISNAVSVAAGDKQSCAVLSDSTIECWGSNSLGELGNATTTNSLTPVPVCGITNAMSVSAGMGHGSAVLSDGTVRYWGDHDGDTGRIPITTPVTVPRIANAVSVASGGWTRQYTCALTSEGTIYCFANVTDATAVGAGDSGTAGPFGAVAVGGDSACAVVRDGTVQCWSRYSAPSAVSGVTNAVGIASGARPHSCVVLDTGAVKCWGNGDLGRLGNGGCQLGCESVGYCTSSDVPVQAIGITSAVAVAAGYCGTCALLGSGEVRCWGCHPGNGGLCSSTPGKVSGF